MPLEYIDDYRDSGKVEVLKKRIDRDSAKLQRKIRLMEVCGGHTMSIHKFGIQSMLPSEIELISGPGCPVCVTPPNYIDAAINWGRRHDGLITTFGDLYRVPGTEASLEEASGEGLKVKVVYSPVEALKLARQRPERDVVFLGVGFETTVPAVASTLAEAAELKLDNFRVMSAHKTIPIALKALVCDDACTIDGFILPGHVSAIIGQAPYQFLAEEYGLACCITGFEPVDILKGILSVSRQCADEAPCVDNCYGRAVRENGNPQAREIVNNIFEPGDSRWRGMGCIPGSGLEIKDDFADFRVFGPSPEDSVPDDQKCSCGNVLKGVIKPPQCRLFGKGCKPEHPVGPCMVSSEGSCAAYYKYGM